MTRFTLQGSSYLQVQFPSGKRLRNYEQQITFLMGPINSKGPFFIANCEITRG